MQPVGAIVSELYGGSMNVIHPAAIEAGPHYNESSVRFNIIDPIIRQLGYPNHESTYLELEEKLEYPYVHIGHRSKKDVPLGFPDYRAGRKGARGSFIIEAKSGSAPITKLEVEQAHSYAAHAQVGANYFVLSNGLEFRVYETLSGPNADPIVMIPISQINCCYYKIENVLSPKNLAKHCKVEYDKKLKLCDGLGSTASIRDGVYKICACEYRMIVNGEDQTELLRANVPQVTQMDQQMEMLKSVFELKVEEGTAWRDEEGRIIARVRFAGATVPNAEAMRLIGVDEIRFTTSDKFLSADADNPTMFEAEKELSVAKGSIMPMLLGGMAEMDSDLEGGLFIQVAMYFDGKEMLGQYRSFSALNVKLPFDATLKLEMDFAGTFTLRPDI